MLTRLDNHAMESIAEQRMQQYRREAEIDHLQRGLHPRQGYRLLQLFGHALTSLGQHLENIDRQDARPIRESDVIGAASLNR